MFSFWVLIVKISSNSLFRLSGPLSVHIHAILIGQFSSHSNDTSSSSCNNLDLIINDGPPIFLSSSNEVPNPTQNHNTTCDNDGVIHRACCDRSSRRPDT